MSACRILSAMPEADGRQELVHRVLDSPRFVRARAARAFLKYVCGNALRETPELQTEADIAAAILNADANGYSGGTVRAQASAVRRKLQQHFATDGAAEPIVIELPLGSYLPVFRSREVEDQRPAPTTRRHLIAMILAGAAVAAPITWILAQRRPPAHLSPPQPAVERLWRQMFDNGRPTSVLLADVNLTQLQDALGESVALAEYGRDRLNARAEEQIQDPETRLKALHMMDRRHTTMADVTLGARVLQLHSALGLPAELAFARDATSSLLARHNVILSGPRRANPWLELFEPRLNFRSHFDEPTRRSSFINTAPREGEAPSYAVEWTRRGYCRVAYLPSRDGQGTALLISGTDLTSSEVGADFITSERWVAELLGHLGVRAQERIPFFEVLLESQVVLTRTSSPVLVAHRVIPAT